MTANETALRMLDGLPSTARYWPLTDETAQDARRLVAEGKLAVDVEHANEGRGVYRLNGPDEPTEKTS